MKKTHIFQMKTILFLNGALCRNLIVTNFQILHDVKYIDF